MSNCFQILLSISTCVATTWVAGERELPGVARPRTYGPGPGPGPAPAPGLDRRTAAALVPRVDCGIWAEVAVEVGGRGDTRDRDSSLGVSASGSSRGVSSQGVRDPFGGRARGLTTQRRGSTAGLHMYVQMHSLWTRK